MKRVLRIATALLFAGVSANAYSLWELQDGENSIQKLCTGTANDNCPAEEDAQGGPIYMYADENDKGNSVSNVPPPKLMPDGVSINPDGVDIGPWLQDHGGEIHFQTRPGADWPLAGIGFKWRDLEDFDFNPTKVEGFGNLAKGISICYAAGSAIDVEISVNETGFTNGRFGFNSIAVKLAPVSEPTHVNFSWLDDFKQAVWADKPETTVGDIETDYLPYTQAIQFVYKGSPNETEDAWFVIGGLGGYDDPDNCADQGVPIKKTIKPVALNMVQYGRTLSFTGLNSTVEVISMQGKLVSKADISDSRNTMSLNGLATGIYMVRANNMTQKIIVK